MHGHDHKAFIVMLQRAPGAAGDRTSVLAHRVHLQFRALLDPVVSLCFYAQSKFDSAPSCLEPHFTSTDHSGARALGELSRLRLRSKKKKKKKRISQQERKMCEFGSHTKIKFFK